jgi:hypothetical protein
VRPGGVKADGDIAGYRGLASEQAAINAQDIAPYPEQQHVSHRIGSVAAAV